MATLKTDVVIVGVGAAGGIIAAELAKAGYNVVGLERGPRLSTDSFQSLDELRYFQRQDTRPNAKKQPVTWRANANGRAMPLASQNYGNQVGGGTVNYGTLSWRFHEDDFRVRSSTVERYGRAFLPDGSSLIDWPLSYNELEPYYDRAEYELGVCGKAGNLKGEKVAGGNVFEAPRQREFPMPPLELDQAGILFDQGSRNLGLHPFPSPRAINSVPYDNRPACTYCTFCQAFGCFVGAKGTVLLNKIPEAERTGRFKVITGAMANRVDTDSDGRATGVSYWGPDGSENKVEAGIVVLSAFIYDNIRLMLLSKTPKHSDGLGNSSGHLGRHMMAHIGSRAFATFDDRHVNIFMGPSAQRHTVDDFNADNFDHKDLGFIRGAQISVHPADLEAGPIGTAMSLLPPPGTPRWGAAYRDFLAKYYTRFASIIAQTENLPYTDNMIDLDPNVRDMFGLPAPRLTYDWRRPDEQKRIAYMSQKVQEIGRAMGASKVWLGGLGPGSPGAHHQGGARMGSNPGESVVNKYGQTWDIPNLFVVGSATHPTMSGFNPTLTIQALAYMTADAIAGKYKGRPGQML